MVDGTVPGWSPRSGDLHYDHHRKGGADIQIAEMLSAPTLYSTGKLPWYMITTQVDADACVAAAWLQLHPQERDKNREFLWAIAFDCDHLVVPDSLSHLSNFAAQAVAALKSSSWKVAVYLGLPTDRKMWTESQKGVFASESFRRGTEWILDACRGDRPWPGQSGEADKYWEEVEENSQMIIDQARISVYRDCLLFNAKGLGGKYIDPRCWIRAAKEIGVTPLLPITLTERDVYRDNAYLGPSYTIGVVPLHPGVESLDYTKGAFAALTEAERERNLHADAWGGRKTVGGSGWNTTSTLLPQEVIDIVLTSLS